MDSLAKLEELFLADFDENATEAEKRENHPSACAVKDVLECTDIGATTYARYRVEFDRTGLRLVGVKTFPLLVYAFESICLTGFLFTRRYSEECYVSFRIIEDCGYVMNTTLIKIAEAQKAMDEMFGNNIAKRKLRGKFHLEILFVDNVRIGDDQLCAKYAMNINARLGDFSDTSCLKEKVKKAEKWRTLSICSKETGFLLLVDMAKKKKAKQMIGNEVACSVTNNGDPAATEPRDFITIAPMLARLCYRFPAEGKANHFIVQKWIVPLPDAILKRGLDRASLYATVAYETFKKSNNAFLTRNTHTMFEFFTEDSRRIVTKLCHHSQNGQEVIEKHLREHDSETFPNVFGFTVYALDVPGFATLKRARSLFNFAMKALEIISLQIDYLVLCYQRAKAGQTLNANTVLGTNSLQGVILKECSEVLEKNCDCDRLHLNSYCNVHLLRDKKFIIKSNPIRMRMWSISLSSFCMSLYKDGAAVPHFSFLISLSDLYVRIAKSLCNSFSGEFRTGTNILCEMTIGENVYCTKLMHHSDVGMESLKKQMFQSEEGKNVKLIKEINVAVYVVDILAFDTNEKAHQFLYNMRKENRGRDIILDELLVGNEANTSIETIDDLEIGYINYETSSPVVHNKKVEGMYITMEEYGKTTKTLNSSYFKKESDIAMKASTEPVQLQDCYNILSSKTPINTSKGRIMVFLVELDFQFYSDVLDNSLFMADILIDIVKNSEISLWSGRRMKITLKLHQGGFPIYVILSSEDLANPENLKEKLIQRGLQSVMNLGKQFYLEVQYRVM